jgi:hypothetical protein
MQLQQGDQLNCAVEKNIARFKDGGGKTINSKTRTMQKVF